MTRSDIGVIISVYAICVFFLYMTLQLKEAAQIYPLCLIGGLALLNTLYLGRCVLKARNAGGELIINDFREVFKDFQGTQFFFVLGACIAYLVALYYLGFYLSSFIYLVTVMFFLRVKKIQLWLTVVFLGALIYCVFSLFLKVPLPQGIIFS